MGVLQFLPAGSVSNHSWLGFLGEFGTGEGERGGQISADEDGREGDPE
jgi:hypothetical protein